MNTYKLAFIGEPGAGKSTCVSTLSQIPIVETEVPYASPLAGKNTTTVAFDYGEMNLGEGSRLLLYGLPGQSRFSHMFDVVREGLLGIVVLVDAASPLGVEGLADTLTTHAERMRQLPFVVVLNKNLSPTANFRTRCIELLRQHDLVAPMLVCDMREREQISNVLRLLLILLEFGFDTNPVLGQLE